MRIQVLPVEGIPEVRAATISPRSWPTARHDRSGRWDVIAITQKIVSKAEGRIVPVGDGGRDAWVERETRRVVARRGDLVIAETRHGFVCANAGVDASNVEEGFLTLLPEDPDASAGTAPPRPSRAARRRGGRRDHGHLRQDLAAWSVNVSIGCAGIPALVDLRGTADHHGRELEATVVALADEVAAASGLAMGKAARVPVAIVRGVGFEPASVPASEMVRPPQEDLFRTSPLLSISERRTIRAFGDGDVSREAVEEAVRAACTAPAPHHTRPWSFTAIWTAAAERRLLRAIADAWREDLRRDGTPEATIERRIARSDAVLGAAPVLIVPWVRFRGAHPYADAERSHAERRCSCCPAARRSRTCSSPSRPRGSPRPRSPRRCSARRRVATRCGMSDEWFALGTVAVGPMPAGAAPPRPPLDLSEHLRTE